MSAAEFGLLSILLSVAQVLSLPYVSAVRPAMRAVSTSKEPWRALWTVNRLAWKLTAFGACLAASALLVAEFAGHDLRVVLSVALLAIPAGQLQLAQAARRGVGDLLAGQVPYELVRPLFAVALLLLAAQWYALDAIGAALLIGLAGLAAFAAVPLLSVQSAPLEDASRTDSSGSLIGVSAMVWFLLATSATLLTGRAEVIILGLEGELEQAGHLAIGLRVIQLGSMGLSFVSFFYGPKLAQAVGQGRDAAQQCCDRVLLGGLLVGGPCSLVMMTYPSLPLVLFGQSSTGAEMTMRIMGVALLVNIVTGPAALLLAMAGRARVLAGIQMVGVFVAGVGTILLASELDWGGAGAHLAGFTLWNAGLAAYSFRRLNVDPTLVGLIARLSRTRNAL